MSVFISIAAPSVTLVFADGASYDRDGIVTRLGCKITCASVPLAITTRGHAQYGQGLTDVIIREAERSGTAAMFDQIQDFADHIKRTMGDRLAGTNDVQVLMAGWLPGTGGAHRFFSTASGQGIPAYQVITPPPELIAGPPLDEATQDAAGVPLMMPGETMPAYFRRAGAPMMQAMREIPSEGIGYAGARFVVGGQVDMVTITGDGCAMETLRAWPDKIGERLDPFRVPTGNIAQRRAARA